MLKKSLKRSDWIAIFSLVFSIGSNWYQVHKADIRAKEQIKISQKISEINEKEQVLKEFQNFRADIDSVRKIPEEEISRNMMYFTNYRIGKNYTSKEVLKKNKTIHNLFLETIKKNGKVVNIREQIVEHEEMRKHFNELENNMLKEINNMKKELEIN